MWVADNIVSAGIPCLSTAVWYNKHNRSKNHTSKNGISNPYENSKLNCVFINYSPSISSSGAEQIPV